MRTSAFVPVVVLNALLALGCTGGLMSSDPPKSEFDRGEYKPLDFPSKQFEAMDLPYYGGKIERSTEGFMEVSYASEATVEQLVEWWPAAVEAEGWKKTSGGPTADGGFGALYDTSDGRRGNLTIHPTGTLWTVEISISPKP